MNFRPIHLLAACATLASAVTACRASPEEQSLIDFISNLAGVARGDVHRVAIQVHLDKSKTNRDYWGRNSDIFVTVHTDFADLVVLPMAAPRFDGQMLAGTAYLTGPIRGREIVVQALDDDTGKLPSFISRMVSNGVMTGSAYEAGGGATIAVAGVSGYVRYESSTGDFKVFDTPKPDFTSKDVDLVAAGTGKLPSFGSETRIPMTYKGKEIGYAIVRTEMGLITRESVSTFAAGFSGGSLLTLTAVVVGWRRRRRGGEGRVGA